MKTTLRFKEKYNADEVAMLLIEEGYRVKIWKFAGSYYIEIMEE